MRTLAAFALAVAPCLTQALAAAEGDGEVAIGHWGHSLIITAPTGAGDINLGPRMQQRLTVDFVDASIADVAEFLRGATQCNIVVDPKVLVAGPVVTLKASNIELGALLHLVTQMTKLHMGFVDGAIYISQEAYQGATRTKLYDVSDLMLPLRNFPGPDMDIPEPGGQGAHLQPPVAEDTPPATIDEVEDLLRKVAMHEK